MNLHFSFLTRWLATVLLACAGHALAQHMHEGAASAPAAKRRPAPLAVGAAFAPNGELWVAALDTQQRLTLQTSADEGRHWSAPRVLDTGGDKIAADGENRPKLAFGPQGGADGWVVISYTEPLAKPYTGRIRMLRSDDGGRSFSAPYTVHQDTQLITHRFESIAVDAKGTLHTLWIDKRDLELQLQAAAPAAEAALAGKRAKPKVDYRGAAIYRNESTDGGKSFGPDLKLADHSCECCRIALSQAPNGSLVALWRHVFAPNERDHAFAPVKVGVTAPVRATLDHWAIDACPHHGPGLAPAAAGGYHAVWFGIRTGDARVRYGRLGADGSPLGQAQPLPDERAEHAAIASADRQLAIVWRSFDGQTTHWRAWLSADDGQHFSLKELGQTADENDHPLLLRRGEQLFALWRTAQETRLERLVF